MSWQDELIPVLRVYIDDLASPYTYTDGRLEQVALASAYVLLNEADLNMSYTISMSSESISPDPASDTAFINLMAMKSACFILKGELKLAQKYGISITDGPSSVSGGKRLDAVQKAYDDMTKRFDMFKLRYLANKTGEAVMTPFTNESVPFGDNFR